METITGGSPEHKALEQLSRVSPDRVFSKLTEWLNGEDEPRRTVAAMVLKNSGNDPAYVLITKALRPKLNETRRTQLLDAAEKLGMALELNHWFELMQSMRHFSPTVQARVLQVLSRCQPQSAVPA